MPDHKGSSALLLLAGTGSQAEVELVALEAQGAGMPWTQGCPALARCPSGCVLLLAKSREWGREGPTQSPGLGVWGTPAKVRALCRARAPTGRAGPQGDRTFPTSCPQSQAPPGMAHLLLYLIIFSKT